MTVLLGLVLGVGLFLVWWSCWDEPSKAARTVRSGQLDDLLRQAGIERVTPTGLLSSCAAVGIFVLLLFFLFTRSAPIAFCFGLFGAWLPLAVVRWRAKRRSASLRELRPDAVDHLRSAIRAGLSLPEALIQLGGEGA